MPGLISTLIGGVLPEVDSHSPSPANPEPVATRISPWHACGPASNYENYSVGMRRNSDLYLLGVTLRLKSGEADIKGAAEQWEKTFGVRRDGKEVQYTNARMGFIQAEDGKADGIVNITIGVEGKRRLEEILWRAKFEGLAVDHTGIVEMLGVNFRFVLVEAKGGGLSKL
jgi:hypothetical protein